MIETHDLLMTARQDFTIFETAIGPCGIAWGAHGVVGLQLPEPSEREMRARLLRRFPAATEPPLPYPRVIQSAIDGIISLLDGNSVDLSSIALDMHGVPEFHQRVYVVARTIPPGATLSYGEIAARLNEPAWPAARDVGQALAQNPFPIVVPCHRVLAAHGKLGGFSASGGTTMKLRLLSIEIASSNASDKRTGPSAGSGSAAAFNIPMFADPV